MKQVKRDVPEWIGKNPNSKIPDRVKLRIFIAHKGKCHLTGLKINPGDKYDFDHIQALANGGQHRESNLAPVLRDKHREKTKRDRGITKKLDRISKKHHGIKKTSGRALQGTKASGIRKKMDGTILELKNGEWVER